MASGIPTTRRTTRVTRATATLDENAPRATVAGKTINLVGKEAIAAQSGPSKPTITSRAAGLSTHSVKDPNGAINAMDGGTGVANGKQVLGTRKRAAFGEVSDRNGGPASNPIGAKDAGRKKVAEKKMTATTASVPTRATAGRRTRTSLAAEQAAALTSHTQDNTDGTDVETAPRRRVPVTTHRTATSSSHASTSTNTSAVPRPIVSTAARRTTSTAGSAATTSSTTRAIKPPPRTTAVDRDVFDAGEGDTKAGLPVEDVLEAEEDAVPAKRARTSSPVKLEIAHTNSRSGSTLSEPPAEVAAMAALAKAEEDALYQEKDKDAGWEDLDAEDADDPMMVSEYVVDIFKYMQELELTTQPNPDYMSIQPELQWKMRGILVDWLIEVHGKFRLLPETLFLAINLVDRFLSARVISLVKLQLVGTTALFVAAKYEEVICPSVQNFLFMADNGFGDDEILGAERYLLQTLDFNMAYPNPIHFLRRISKADNYDIQTRTVAKYFMEIACVDHKMLHLKPSLIAAGAAWLARHVLNRGKWNANLVHYSSFAEDELLPAAQLMLNYILRPLEKQAECFTKKYASKKYMKASTYVREWAIHRYRTDDEEFCEMEGLVFNPPKGDELRFDIELMKTRQTSASDGEDGEGHTNSDY